MWHNKRILETESEPVPMLVTSKDLVNSEFIAKTPVDDFMFQEVEIDGEKSIRLTSDIYMLFNQQRLNKLSRESLIDYFNSLPVSNPQFSELRSKMTDDQLVQFVKSRYIQSPSELMAWSSYLMSSSDSEIAALAAASQTVEPAHSAEPTPASTE